MVKAIFYIGSYKIMFLHCNWQLKKRLISCSIFKNKSQMPYCIEFLLGACVKLNCVH